MVSQGTSGSVFSTVNRTFLVGTTVPSGTALILNHKKIFCQFYYYTFDMILGNTKAEVLTDAQIFLFLVSIMDGQFSIVAS